MKRTPTTTATTIFTTDVAPLVSVNAGLPISAALEQASCILAAIGDLAINIGENSAAGSEVFAIHYLTDAAKGLVDASIGGLLAAQHDTEGKP